MTTTTITTTERRERTSNISHIVTNIVSNGSRITRVIFWDTMDNLSNEISSDIGGLGVDTTTDTSKLGSDPKK